MSPSPPFVSPRGRLYGGRERKFHGRRPDAKLSLSQVRAAWTIYESGLSLDDLAAKLWQRYGYASQTACHKSLHEAFVGEGKKLRTRREAARLRLERDPEARETLRRAVAKAREGKLAKSPVLASAGKEGA